MSLAPSTNESLLAALAWQIELGADECIGGAPANRFDEAAKAPALPGPVAARPREPESTPTPMPRQAAVVAPQETESAGAVTEARRLAAEAETLEGLHQAMAGFDGCALKKGARNTVFADGNPAARVMFIGEAPGRDEDREGKPFVGRSGQLLDRMLAAIGLDRRSEDASTAAYITNVLPWRPLADRDPSTDESLMMWAFLERHIELAAPEVIVTLGRPAASVLTERAIRMTRERGRWERPMRGGGRPVLLTLHPAYLLRQPAEKAKVWRDLLSLRAVLDGAEPRIED